MQYRHYLTWCQTIDGAIILVKQDDENVWTVFIANSHVRDILDRTEICPVMPGRQTQIKTGERRLFLQTIKAALAQHDVNLDIRYRLSIDWVSADGQWRLGRWRPGLEQEKRHSYWMIRSHIRGCAFEELPVVKGEQYFRTRQAAIQHAQGQQ